MRRVFRHSVTQAIVLQSRQFGEIHKSVTLFTAGEGLVTAIAHGAKKMASRLRSTTEVFCLSRVYLYHDPVKRSTKITDMEGLSLFHGIRGSLSRYYAASLWAEVILKSFGGGDSAGALFALLQESLMLCEDASPEVTGRLTLQFLWRTLALTGNASDPRRCGRCGRDMGPDEPVSAGGPDAPLVCAACSRALGSARALPAGALRYLQQTVAQPLSAAAAVAVDPAVGEALREALLGLVQDVLELPLSAAIVEPAAARGGFGAGRAMVDRPSGSARGNA
jgi:DNA repair protein RecO (recombination protein O)